MISTHGVSIGTAPPERVKEWKEGGRPIAFTHSDADFPVPEPTIKTVLTMTLGCSRCWRSGDRACGLPLFQCDLARDFACIAIVAWSEANPRRRFALGFSQATRLTADFISFAKGISFATNPTSCARNECCRECLARAALVKHGRQCDQVLLARPSAPERLLNSSEFYSWEVPFLTEQALRSSPWCGAS